MNTWNISTIEALTEPEAQALALETLPVKGHTVYLIDFEGYFGYSACVFAEGHHIYYANDYALHHRGKDHAALRTLYVEKLGRILYTDEELSRPLADADDYERRNYYLHNYYSQRRDYVSIFCGGSEEEQEARRAQMAGKVFDRYSFAYYADADFVARHAALMEALEAQRNSNADNYDYWRGAFLAQMYNIEYGINWQPDYDCLSHFGNIHYTEADDEILQYFDQLSFTDAQRRAYMDARREYFRREATG